MIVYREALEEDYIKINDFHNRIYKSNRTIEEFYWEFHNCPVGKSIYIIALDGEKVVGTNCVIPIELINNKQEIILTGKSEDTLVDPDYRGQKIFYNIYEVLFQACEKNGVKVIWGFTSAKKPFKKLGFNIPYDHEQNLLVNKIFKSYSYLVSLNSKNTLFSKFKIFSLCFLSKFKSKLNFEKSIIKEYSLSVNLPITESIDELIHVNLSSEENSFAIYQNSAFQDWRIYSNPNFSKVHTYGFYDSENKLVSLLVFNSHLNGVAYLCQANFDVCLSNKEKSQMIKLVSKKMFSEEIIQIRSWQFSHNALNTNEKQLFIKANYIHLNRGVGFVWKEIGDFNLNPNDFYLSRIATQGVI